MTENPPSVPDQEQAQFPEKEKEAQRRLLRQIITPAYWADLSPVLHPALGEIKQTVKGKYRAEDPTTFLKINIQTLTNTKSEITQQIIELFHFLAFDPALFQTDNPEDACQIPHRKGALDQIMMPLLHTLRYLQGETQDADSAIPVGPNSNVAEAMQLVQTVWVIEMDIKGLRELDQIDPQLGDTAIARLARIVTDQAENSPLNLVPARVGGDEFGLYAISTESQPVTQEQINQIIQQIQDAVGQVKIEYHNEEGKQTRQLELKEINSHCFPVLSLANDQEDETKEQALNATLNLLYATLHGYALDSQALGSIAQLSPQDKIQPYLASLEQRADTVNQIISMTNNQFQQELAQFQAAYPHLTPQIELIRQLFSEDLDDTNEVQDAAAADLISKHDLIARLLYVRLKNNHTDALLTDTCLPFAELESFLASKQGEKMKVWHISLEGFIKPSNTTLGYFQTDQTIKEFWENINNKLPDNVPVFRKGMDFFVVLSSDAALPELPAFQVPEQIQTAYGFSNYPVSLGQAVFDSEASAKEVIRQAEEDSRRAFVLSLCQMMKDSKTNKVEGILKFYLSPPKRTQERMQRILQILNEIREVESNTKYSLIDLVHKVVSQLEQD